MRNRLSFSKSSIVWAPLWGQVNLDVDFSWFDLTTTLFVWVEKSEKHCRPVFTSTSFRFSGETSVFDIMKSVQLSSFQLQYHIHWIQYSNPIINILFPFLALPYLTIFFLVNCQQSSGHFIWDHPNMSYGFFSQVFVFCSHDTVAHPILL